MALQYVSDGSGLEIVRHPNVFKSASGNTGTWTIWTPATGKRFRLLRYEIEITADAYASAAGDIAITLLDSSTSLGFIHYFAVPATAPTTLGPSYSTGWVDLGGIGMLSAAVGNNLRIVTNTTLTAGKISVRVAGTEE